MMVTFVPFAEASMLWKRASWAHAPNIKQLLVRGPTEKRAERLVAELGVLVTVLLEPEATPRTELECAVCTEPSNPNTTANSPKAFFSFAITNLKTILNKLILAGSDGNTGGTKK